MMDPASDKGESAPPNVTSIESKKGDICRIFISRKTSDKAILCAGSANQKKLTAFANERLEFFDADLIPKGANWRETIRSEIRKADILLLILTRPARKDFDWPLYEAGLFDSLTVDGTGGGKKDGKLICIYPEKEQPPDQLKDIQGIEATKENILDFLKDLFGNADLTNTDTPLNPEIFEAVRGEMSAVAADIYANINGVKNDVVYEYVNPFIQLRIPWGSSTVREDTEIESNERSLRELFGLKETPTNKERWTWGDLSKEVDTGDETLRAYNKRWMDEAEAAIGLMVDEGRSDQQISSRFIDKNGEIWDPEIEIWRRYNGDRTTVDITFSPDVQITWLKNAGAPIALAANISLASRIRHELIDEYLPRLARRSDVDDTIRKLGVLVDTIEADGFIIRWLTNDSYWKAFELHDQKKLDALEEDFRDNIRGKLHEALQAKNVEGTVAALEKWRINNAEFFTVGISRYTGLIGLGD